MQEVSTSSLALPPVHPLDVFFHPKNIAIIGASDRIGSPGEALAENIYAWRRGEIFPVNPNRTSIKGHPAYRRVPPSTDLAIIATPAAMVPEIISQCVEANVRGAVVISAGFREAGAAGKALEADIAERIRGTSLRVIGPNCIGVMNPIAGLNATFARKSALPGSVAIISQSGALCTAILDWSLSEALGFSAFVSVGSMLDVGWGDLIDYFGNDPDTESIVLYMESIGSMGRIVNDAHADAPRFLSAARAVARRKPIIVIKAGRTPAAAKAAASHTGAMTGSDAVLDAAFRRAGVLRLDWIGDFFHIAEVLAKQPRPKGRRLAIVTNAGGPGVLAADALMEGGGELAPITADTMQALNALLPPHWSHGNPIDILADSTEATFERAVELALLDENTDGVLALTAPLIAARPISMASRISKYTHVGKPLLASFMGGSDVSDAEGLLSRNGIPTFAFPDDAARVFNYMWKFGETIEVLTAGDKIPPSSPKPVPVIDKVRKEGRRILTEVESKEVLRAYGIPVVDTYAAKTAEEAVEAARKIGFPVVVKLLSTTITHKSDVDGVRLNLTNEDAVRKAFDEIKRTVTDQTSLSKLLPSTQGNGKAGVSDFDGVSVQRMIKQDGFELIVGSSTDPQFGPIILLGTGGVFAEVLHDMALELPPLNRTLARRLLERLRIWPALNGSRGRHPINMPALEAVLVSFSDLLLNEPRISEIDINPVAVTSEYAMALDARIVLHDPLIPFDELPRPAMCSSPTSSQL